MSANQSRPNAIIAQIPNCITGLNLLSGGLSVVMSLYEHNLSWAIGFIILAAVFDFFDGMIARALGVSSPIGKDLDSLADVISFGLAPGAMLWVVLTQVYNLPFAQASVALLIAVFAGFRLAKFNNDTRQTTSFIGLPVPANALFWIGYLSLLEQFIPSHQATSAFICSTISVVFIGWMMVGELPMFSFKLGGGKAGEKKSPLPQISLIVVALVSIAGGLVLGFGLIGFFITILYYILISAFLATK